MPGKVIRFHDYERRSREPDAEGPRDPAEPCVIIVLHCEARNFSRLAQPDVGIIDKHDHALARVERRTQVVVPALICPLRRDRRQGRSVEIGELGSECHGGALSSVTHVTRPCYACQQRNVKKEARPEPSLRRWLGYGQLGLRTAAPARRTRARAS